MPPRERQYITNWQLSIIAAARVHDLEFIRCLRLISQVMMFLLMYFKDFLFAIPRSKFSRRIISMKL